MTFLPRILKSIAAAVLVASQVSYAFAQTSPGPAGSREKNILVIGDSLSSEYGIARDSGWVNILRQRLSRDYPDFAVVNASISGDTTSGGAARAPAAIERHKPAILILELGGNDALRGLNLAAAEKNLSGIVTRAQDAGAQTLLVGMMIPPNFGRTYADAFKEMFVTVSRTHKTELVPFFFEGLTLDDTHMQADGIHPNASAQQKLFENVWKKLEPMLKG